jgi:hypothetical protein
MKEDVQAKPTAWTRVRLSARRNWLPGLALLAVVAGPALGAFIGYSIGKANEPYYDFGSTTLIDTAIGFMAGVVGGLGVAGLLLLVIEEKE